jgi:hypothetical protein
MLYQHLKGGEPCPVIGVPRTGDWVLQTREPETLEEKYICDGCVTFKRNTYSLLPLPPKKAASLNATNFPCIDSAKRYESGMI